jgi:integrase
LPINNDVILLLGERKNSDCKVFDKIGISTYHNMIIKFWVQAAKIDKHITFHCFRHTYATLLLNNDVDLYTVSKMLGHRDIKTTQIYAKISDSKKRNAANAINLNVDNLNKKF